MLEGQQGEEEQRRVPYRRQGEAPIFFPSLLARASFRRRRLFKGERSRFGESEGGEGEESKQRPEEET